MKTIRYRFKILKNKFAICVFNIRRFFKIVFCKKTYKTVNKKSMLGIAGVWLLGTITLTLSAAITAHTPINRSQSIAELIYNNNVGKDTLGFITPFETSQNTYTLCSVQPEKSAKFRNINSTAELYDCYPANYRNTTPATVDYIDEEKVNISFVLIPKENYTNVYFSAPHIFKLLVGGTSNSSNIEDIYINKKYADKLINDSPDLSDYKQLLDKKISLPYKNTYVSNKSIEYVIKGVLDDEDDKYKRYQSFVGDFFLANQYLNLPINGTVVFELPTKLDEIRSMVDSLFKIYEYDTIARYFSAVNFTFAYEYRIYEIEAIGSNNNDMFKIEDKSNTVFKKFNSVYENYLSKAYILPLIIISIALLTLIITFIALMIAIYKSFKKSKLLSFAIFISILLSFPTAIGTNFLYKLLFLKSLYVSITSWQTFVFMLVVLMVLIITWLLCKKHRKLV